MKIKHTIKAKFIVDDLQRWIEKSRTIQWDYKNVYKRKGKLERLLVL